MSSGDTDERAIAGEAERSSIAQAEVEELPLAVPALPFAEVVSEEQFPCGQVLIPDESEKAGRVQRVSACRGE